MTALVSLKAPRYYHACVINADNYLVVAGGNANFDTGRKYNSVEKYDLQR
jgi:hypothetical protein